MYEDILATLSKRLPPLTYIAGGRQTGKTTLVKNILKAHELGPGDTLWVDELTDPSFVTTWLTTYATGDRQVLVFDGTLTPTFREKLLLWTEEPPKNFFVIVTAEVIALDTLMSRAEVYKLALNPNYAPPVFTEVRGGVLALLRAFETLEESSLDEVAKRWTDNHTDLLLVWCKEKLTKDFKVFTGEEVEVPDSLPMMLLKSMVSDVRPRFLIRGPIAELLGSMK